MPCLKRCPYFRVVLTEGFHCMHVNPFMMGSDKPVIPGQWVHDLSLSLVVLISCSLLVPIRFIYSPSFSVIVGRAYWCPSGLYILPVSV